MKSNIGIYNKKIRHIHLEPTTDCNARCPQCPRTWKAGLQTHPSLPIDEWTAEELREVLSHDFFSGVERVLVNGNFGDIVKHSNPRQLVQVLIDKDLDTIELRTNGGAQSIDFWKWLGTIDNLTVEFGIDGLADTHHLYRRNTRFDVVIKNARAFIESGGTASWAMTVFKHNQHQVDECRELSKEMGFTNFKMRPSTRWHKHQPLSILDKNQIESYKLEPADSVKPDNLPKQTPQLTDIDCVVTYGSVYLSGTKRLWPCCWTEQRYMDSLMNDSLDTDDFIMEFVKKMGLPEDFNQITKYSIDHVINSGLFRTVEQSWSTTPFKACSSMCGKSSLFKLQQSLTENTETNK